MINNKDMDNKFGQMVQYIKDSIKMERNMEKVNFNGLIILHTKESLLTITSMDLENILGKIVEFIKEQ